MKHRKLPKRLRIGAGILFFLVTALTFSGTAAGCALLFKAQAGPALMRAIGNPSLGAAAVCLALVLVTLLFGRIYCAVFCPLGLLQDIVAFLSRRKAKKVRDFHILRSAVAGIVLGLLFGGVNAGFLALDPYSNFGRIAGAFTVAGAAVFVVIAALAVWKKRIFCTALCPVGTVLGLFAKAGFSRLIIGEKCLKCGKCEKLCPAGCIDVSRGVIDNGRCVRCFDCLAACPVNSISLEIGKNDLADGSRRRFLISGGILLAGLAAGAAAARTGLFEAARKLKILPPGAGDPGRFTKKCTACLLCAVNCPSKIIVPAKYGAGPVELDLSRGSCNWDCARCSRICPTGALPFLSLAEKRKIKIAEANFDPRKCIAFQEGTPCGRCAKACPTGAVVLRKNGTPRPVKTDLCVGCGACQEACPAAPKAITVHAVEKQSRID
ncbi:MAG: 4Fe-4S dicluster domain-containing protein [Lentisphaeria bacterium]|nr:4Fe-4S dicluster domain-containing protein [Lentisphaeria bacterium]